MFFHAPLHSLPPSLVKRLQILWRIKIIKKKEQQQKYIILKNVVRYSYSNTIVKKLSLDPS